MCCNFCVVALLSQMQKTCLRKFCGRGCTFFIMLGLWAWVGVLVHDLCFLISSLFRQLGSSYCGHHWFIIIIIFFFFCFFWWIFLIFICFFVFLYGISVILYGGSKERVKECQDCGWLWSQGRSKLFVLVAVVLIELLHEGVAIVEFRMM